LSPNDLNRVAYDAIRSLLMGAHDFQFTLRDQPVNVQVETQVSPPWPGTIEGLDPERDGPWPAPVRITPLSESDAQPLLLSAGYWPLPGPYHHKVGIRVQTLRGSTDILWITVASRLLGTTSDEPVAMPVSLSLFKRAGEVTEVIARFNEEIAQQVAQLLPEGAGTRLNRHIFSVVPSSGAVLPSPEQAFKDLVKVALIKAPYVTRKIRSTREPTTKVEAPAAAQSRLTGIWPLPGGDRAYKTTLDELLDWISAERRDEADFRAHMAGSYNATGERAVSGYLRLLTGTGLVARDGGHLVLTREGNAYRASRDPLALYAVLNARYCGLEDLVRQMGIGGPLSQDAALQYLNARLDLEWKTRNQVMFRLNWLLSLGLTERTPLGDVLTELGKSTLLNSTNPPPDDWPAKEAPRLPPLLCLTDAVSADDADLAFAPSGTGGYGAFGTSILRRRGHPGPIGSDQLDTIADRGFVLLYADSAPVMLVLTNDAQPRNTPQILETSLSRALRSSEFIDHADRRVWIPLMGTGGGGITPSDSLRITGKAIFQATRGWDGEVILAMDPNWPQEVKRDLTRQFGELAAELGWPSEQLTLMDTDGGKGDEAPPVDASQFTPEGFAALEKIYQAHRQRKAARGVDRQDLENGILSPFSKLLAHVSTTVLGPLVNEARLLGDDRLELSPDRIMTQQKADVLEVPYVWAGYYPRSHGSCERGARLSMIVHRSGIDVGLTLRDAPEEAKGRFTRALMDPQGKRALDVLKRSPRPVMLVPMDSRLGPGDPLADESTPESLGRLVEPGNNLGLMMRLSVEEACSDVLWLSMGEALGAMLPLYLAALIDPLGPALDILDVPKLESTRSDDIGHGTAAFNAEVRPQVRLQEFLKARFSVDELRRFAWRLPDGEDLRSDLPESVPLGALVDDFVHLLGRRGSIDDPFFDALAAERPRFREEIESLRAIWRLPSNTPMPVGPSFREPGSRPPPIGAATRREPVATSASDVREVPDPQAAVAVAEDDAPRNAPRSAGPKSSSARIDTSTDLWLKWNGENRVLKRGANEISLGEAPIEWDSALFLNDEDKPCTLASAQDGLVLGWDRATLLRFGARLATLLCGGDPPREVHDAFEPPPPGQTRRLILDLHGPAAAVPWEYLALDGKFLVEQRFSVIRHVAADHPRPARLAGPDTVLLASARPEDLEPFDVETHNNALFQAIVDAGGRLIPLGRCSRDTLRDAVLRVDPAPSILHFLGHGLAPSDQEESGLALLGDNNERASRLKASELATWIGQSGQLELIVLGSCYSGAVVPSAPWGSLASTIVGSSGAPVVAMQFAVPQDYSTAFLAELYRTLHRVGGDVELAVHQARSFPGPETAPRSAFGIPALYVDARALGRAPPDPAEPGRLRFERIGQTVSLRFALESLPPAVLPASADTAPPPLEHAERRVTPPPKDAAGLATWAADVIRVVPAAEHLLARAAPPPPRAPPRPAALDASTEAIETLDDLPLQLPALHSLLVQPSILEIETFYSYPSDLLPRVLAELSAGRHVLLHGPVGTGKTTLAVAVAQALGYQAYVATASADWTQFEVVGGLAPRIKEDKLGFVFRNGAFLEAALANWAPEPNAPHVWRRSISPPYRGCWLILDELNRADIDRALGGLMSALETRRLRVATRPEDPTATRELPIPLDFRVIATINNADRHYLFRLSDALKRRFAFVEVPAATDLAAEWASLDRQAGSRGQDTALEAELRRFVYLVRALHPLGSAQVLGALRLLRASGGTTRLSDELRIHQAVAGSLLTGLEDLGAEGLRALRAWCEGLGTDEVARALFQSWGGKKRRDPLPPAQTSLLRALAALPDLGADPDPGPWDGTDREAAANWLARRLARGQPSTTLLLSALDRMIDDDPEA